MAKKNTRKKTVTKKAVTTLAHDETCRLLGVNNIETYGRQTFAEFCDVYAMQADFEAKVEDEFNKMIESFAGATVQ